MADKNTIKNWFRTGLKPTQAQFWAWMDSYFHKDEKIPITAIDDIENILNAKAEAEVLENHLTDPNAHAESIGMKTDKGDYEGTSEDLDNRIAAIENPDRVLKFGTITVTGLNVDIASNAFSWVLNKQAFLTPAVFTDILDAATTGMYRSDVVVGTQTGGYDIITGDEAVTGAGATEKAPPAGTIRLGYIFLQGNTVLGSGSAPAEEKSTIIDADRIIFDNSQNSYAKASIKLSNFKTVLKAWLDSFFKDRYVTIVDNVTTAYTLQLSVGTKNTLIRHNNASAITETIPANATVAFPIGTEIKSISIGVGLRTVAPAAGVTILNHVSLTSAQNQMMRFIKTATNTWVVTGDVGFEKDIKLSNYPSTRNDGQLPSNKVLSTDVNGNLKLYSMAVLPAPYISELIPDSHLPSTTGNIELIGEFFIPAMCLTANLNNGNGLQITGQTISYATFVNSQKILMNVTTGATEGYFSITCNNGLTTTKPNALVIVLGNVYNFSPADFPSLTSAISASSSNLIVSNVTVVNQAISNKAFDVTKNWRFSFYTSVSPLFGTLVNGQVPNTGVDAMMNLCFLDVSNNSLQMRHVFGGNSICYLESGAYVSSNTFFFSGASMLEFWNTKKVIEYRYNASTRILSSYLNGLLMGSATLLIPFPNNLKIQFRTKMLDIYNIKYVETA